VGDLALDGDVLPLANQNYSLGGGAAFYPASGLELTLSASYSRKGYDTFSQPGDIERVDGLWSGSATGSYRLNPRLKPFAFLTLNWNNSTLGADSVSDLNYRQWIAGAGLSWSALP
jgi:hypothetical protein